jgi:hypothetical protein
LSDKKLTDERKIASTSNQPWIEFSIQGLILKMLFVGCWLLVVPNNKQQPTNNHYFFKGMIYARRTIITTTTTASTTTRY